MTLPQPSDGFEWTQAPWGPVLRCRPLGEIADHFFTSGNLELRDSREEWDQVADVIGLDFDRVLLLRQVHGADVAVRHRGEYESGPRPEADIAVTDDPTIALGVRVADCAPILIADRRTGAVGAAHAGWRGAVQGAAIAAVRAMQKEFGSRTEDLITAIGPCLGACCGEVGPDVVDAFRQAGHSAEDIARWLTKGSTDRFQLDLPLANHDQLAALGIPPAQIHVAALCTKSFPDVFHSYRVQKERAGRMAGVVRAQAQGSRLRTMVG